jgi:putative tryptophan/tyrosine transport system substrate-binding protein
MMRREFIRLVGAAAVWPVVARGQQPAMPIIGYLNASSTAINPEFLQAFRQGLAETGYVEGQNVMIEYRWAADQYDRLPALAADLVRRRVAVITATGGPATAMAAKGATASIPIVFTSGADPVNAGLVESLNRPGGNITGMSLFYAQLGTKRLALLRELLVSKADVVAFLVNTSSVEGSSQLEDVRAAARAAGQQVIVLEARTEREIDEAFASIIEQRAGALLVGSEPFFTFRRAQIITLAARHAIPAMYQGRGDGEAGGLMSYGASITDMYRQAGGYVSSILKGAKPADLPVRQPTKFELVINLKTARALGLTVPDKLLALADEVIE